MTRYTALKYASRRCIHASGFNTASILFIFLQRSNTAQYYNKARTKALVQSLKTRYEAHTAQSTRSKWSRTKRAYQADECEANARSIWDF